LLVMASLLVTPASGAAAQTVVVTVDTGNPARIVRPLEALGSTVDKEPAGSIPSLYSRHNVTQMLAAGYGWLSYRLFTELSSQDWHWNPAGTFSAGNQGYWTSSDALASPPIADSFGYRLPHRGGTSDQGNNEDYARLDDGDPHSYWKSDPYLTSRFTHESDALHPQWIVVDLERARPVNAIRIAWANPYATDARIEYWVGDDPINDPGHGSWRGFPDGRLRNPSFPNDRERALGAQPLSVRYVRILMTRSSNTCDSHGSTDVRNCVGFAIGEISVGLRNGNGAFHDYIHHAACGGENPGKQRCGQRQTAMYVSSVDPWHAASNRVHNQEQPGLDLIARSGLTRNLPATYPVPMLYSTPENAVAEVRYLKARGYPIARIELGEEPDGQYVTPEDYAALYVQWARALHALDPELRLGGPIFSGVNSDVQAWRDASGNVSWLNRFLRYLSAHHAMGDLSFMSFEHYPFNGCEQGDQLLHDLIVEPSIIRGIVRTWRRDGLPANVPLFITEANFSAVNFSETPMRIEGALWQADYLASALTMGVDGAVYYQYEPVPLSQNAGCPSDWGNLTMFVADRNGTIRARGAQFWAGQMLMQQWFAPGDAAHELYSATTNLLRHGFPLMTAYALKRPDGAWSVMLVNKDDRAHSVVVRFGSGVRANGLRGSVTRVTFGSAQYVWRKRGARSLPNPDEPPTTTALPGGDSATYVIPAQSITVLRGQTTTRR
jgi:hypothetical protein